MRNVCQLQKQIYKLFLHTYSLNRQYNTAMRNMSIQMHKQLYKLKKRTSRVEKILSKQIKPTHPVIRIPRLTRDELSNICINNDQTNKQNNELIVLDDKEDNKQIESVSTNDIECLDDNKNENENFISVDSKPNINLIQSSISKTKYCFKCNHNFSHRSAFLRHIRKQHNATDSTEFERNDPTQENNLPKEGNSLFDDRPEDDATESGILQMSNQWDFGEGRLRPRPASKSSIKPNEKVKCDICNKFFRAVYIKKHVRRSHGLKEIKSLDALNDPVEQTQSDNILIDETNSMNEKSPSVMNISSASSETITETDPSDLQLKIPEIPKKKIFLATTCLNPVQMVLVHDFMGKFSTIVSDSASVTCETTHLITNDDDRQSYAPLSLKLLSAIANHCFCLSHRWIAECLEHNRIVEEEPFEIEGTDADLSSIGGPKRSRLAYKRNSLFENMRFIVKCIENSDLTISTVTLQELIETCGGKIITCVTQELLNNYQIIVLCDESYISEQRDNFNKCHSLNIKFLSPDWILQSILEHRVVPFLTFELKPF